MHIEQPCLVLMGPTAIGKTELSLSLACRFGCEIISVDSMQVYRYMDIGTAKVSREAQAEVPHHLIDIVDPDEPYDSARFAEDALKAIKEIHGRGNIPLLTGGTGLYLRALLEGIFPGVPGDDGTRRRLKVRLRQEGASILHKELYACDRYSAERIHENDTQRLLRALEVFYVSGMPWSEHIRRHKISQENVFSNMLQLALTSDRQLLYQRINMRTTLMLTSGLEKEVRQLLAMGYARDLKPFGSIGYRHMINFIDEKWEWEEMERLLSRDTRRYAKRQYTWFSSLDALRWFDISRQEEIFHAVDGWLTQIARNKS